MKSEVGLDPLFTRLESVVRSHIDEVKRTLVRDLRRMEYERDDARRNEKRANNRLQQMREALAERDAEIARLRPYERL